MDTNIKILLKGEYWDHYRWNQSSQVIIDIHTHLSYRLMRHHNNQNRDV